MKQFLPIGLTLVMLTACTTGLWSGSAPPEDSSVPPVPMITPEATPLEAGEPGVPKLIIPSWPESGKLSRTVRRPAAEMFIGSEEFLERPRTGKKTVDEGDIVLNFANAELSDVAKAVLGEMLHLNYTVAPAVQGTMTIAINRPIPKKKVLPVLNTLFRLNGAALIESGNLVKVVPVAEAPKQGAPLSLANRTASAPGFGLQIVSLRYVGAEDMKRMLDPVAPAGSVIPVDSVRNILILAGTEDERASMMDLVETFDMDWLSGMSFGLFPLKDSNAKTMVGQLWEVLGTSTGPLAKVVRLVPLERQNAVLTISSQPRYVKEVKTWIERLDMDQAPSEERMWVYAVQNGRAAALAETLNQLMNGTQSVSGPSKKEDGIPAPPPLSVATMAVANNTPLTPPPAGPLSGKGSMTASGSGPRVIADEATNSLIIMGTRAEFGLIEEALKKLDIVPLQVRIEAVIAEVTLTDDLRYGVQYLFKNKNVGTVLTNASTVAVAPTVPGFSAFITASKISTVLDLLQSVTTVNVISSPQLMVLNNQTAVLQIGDQVPVATQSAVSVTTPGAPVVNSIQLKDTGVILKVTPRVNASGLVVMDIAQEVSDVAKTTTSSLDSPTIQQRKITSSVAVRDGQTVALGGMIRDSVTDGKDGIPVLEDIPVAGALFSTTTKNSTRTELLALITPHVIRSDDDMRTVTNEMREQMKAVLPLDAKLHSTR